MTYKLIKITNSDLSVKVDLEDYNKLNKYKWHLMTTGRSNKYLRPVRYENRKTIRMHREIMNCKAFVCEVDHINHDTLDNRKQNLRLCNRSQNMFNRKNGTRNTSGYKGDLISGRAGISTLRLRRRPGIVGATPTRE